MNEQSQSNSPKRLPDSWVQKIFATMQGHYGTRFLNMWKTGQILPDGSDAGMINAMNHWAEKLGGFVDHKETIKRALANLPPDPPSLPAFAEHLRRSHVPPAPVLLQHVLTPEEEAANKQRIAEVLARAKEILHDKKIPDDSQH